MEDSAAQGPVQVRGRTEPVQVYGVTGHRHGRSRLEVSIDRGLTPLVGRALDLSRAMDMTRWLPQAEWALAQANRRGPTGGGRG